MMSMKKKKETRKNMEKISDVLKEERGLLFFDDNETFTNSLEDSQVVWLTEEGEEEVDDGRKLYGLDEEEKVLGYVKVSKLIECWMEKYGSLTYKTQFPTLENEYKR